jgi:hypothetical protein
MAAPEPVDPAVAARIVEWLTAWHRDADPGEDTPYATVTILDSVGKPLGQAVLTRRQADELAAWQAGVASTTSALNADLGPDPQDGAARQRAERSRARRYDRYARDLVHDLRADPDRLAALATPAAPSMPAAPRPGTRPPAGTRPAPTWPS